MDIERGILEGARKAGMSLALVPCTSYAELVCASAQLWVNSTIHLAGTGWGRSGLGGAKGGRGHSKGAGGPVNCAPILESWRSLHQFAGTSPAVRRAREGSCCTCLVQPDIVGSEKM